MIVNVIVNASEAVFHHSFWVSAYELKPKNPYFSNRASGR